MKKMLITASAVGAAIAGMILYARNRADKPRQLNGNASGKNYLKDGLGKIERNAMHSMG